MKKIIIILAIIILVVSLEELVGNTIILWLISDYLSAF